LDSESGFSLKKFSWSSLKTRLKLYFDTLYATAGSFGDALTNTSVSIDDELVLFSGTGGKTLKRAISSGLAKLTNGVLSSAVAGTDYAKPNTSSSWSAGQRGAVTAANTASYDMNAGNNFTTTLAVGQTMAFTNITAGQSGNIYLTNGSNYTMAKNSYIKCSSSFLTTISATGSYWITYYSPDGTNVVVTTSGAVS
jgi:uncharacterized MAPEG superfamily protein